MIGFKLLTRIITVLCFIIIFVAVAIIDSDSPMLLDKLLDFVWVFADIYNISIFQMGIVVITI